MRVAPVVGLSLLIAMTGPSDAVASDVKRTSQAVQVAQAEPTRPSLLSEVRLGFSAQDPSGAESGSANLTGEILFAKPFTPADLFTSYFIPRPHIGGSLNFDHKTSFAYAGLTWTVDVTSRIFVEGSFGGAVHNGSTSDFFTPSDRQALGCSPLFRESGSVGVRLSANWSVMATVEHMSNAGFCSDNRGLTNVGARLGYTF
jgi:lipid A 3-O-deacylase